MFKMVCLTMGLAGLAGSAMAASRVQCALPKDFVDTPPPAIEKPLLVTHVEQIVIGRPLDKVMTEGGTDVPIEKTLRPTRGLPGVAGTHALRGTWAQPSAQRVTCLTDGGWTEEEVLDNRRSGNAHHFSYEIWNYTTPQARPVAYAVGDFFETDLGDGRTRVRWTYAFRLRSDRFPGSWGPLGRALFSAFYLDTRYGAFMRNALATRKAGAESPDPSDPAEARAGAARTG
jgi:hypothetical protein